MKLKKYMDANKNLNSSKYIVTQKVDKTNQYVIRNYTDYKSKLDQILLDINKFSKRSYRAIKKKIINL